MSSTGDAKLTTEALKGLAILIVILAHYAQFFASDFYEHWVRGYAFGVVSIFFVLAGYGAFYSLERRWDKANKKKVIGSYFISRALRIYPLYWAALFLTPIYWPQYGFLWGISPNTAGIYLALPFVNGPGIFWFVPAIIQCYLLAPPLYSLLAKFKAKKFLTLNLAVMPLLVPVTVFYLSQVGDTSDDPLLNIFFYKNLFLTNVILFSLGMVISPLASQLKAGIIRNRKFVLPAFAIFALMLYLTRGSHAFYEQQQDLLLILLIPFFILSCFALCLILVGSNARMPLAGVLRYPGKDSYYLYLFHMIFIAILYRTSLIRNNELLSFFIFVSLLPFFVLLMRWLVYGFGNLWTAPAEE